MKVLLQPGSGHAYISSSSLLGGGGGVSTFPTAQISKAKAQLKFIFLNSLRAPSSTFLVLRSLQDNNEYLFLRGCASMSSLIIVLRAPTCTIGGCIRGCVNIDKCFMCSKEHPLLSGDRTINIFLRSVHSLTIQGA